jgi:hypothetical protein
VTVKLLVVCEAASDFRIASGLADRVLCEHIEWLDESVLASVRAWMEVAPDQPYVRWDKLDRTAEQHGFRRLRPRSRFAGEPGAADAAAADKALQLAALIGGKRGLGGVLLIRDADDQPERGRGLAQARTLDAGQRWPFAVVIGLAVPKREAWVLAGFEPRESGERERLATLRRELGHDPCAGSHRIAARSHGAKRDIKRVLDVLTENDGEREAACWRSTPLAQLKGRGSENGLAAYLDEVAQHLVPIVQP